MKTKNGYGIIKEISGYLNTRIGLVMFITLVLTCAFAHHKGYTLRPLTRACELYPIVAFELFGIFLQANIFFGNYTYVKWADFLKPLSLMLYLLPILKHRLFAPAITGSCLIFAGTFLNKLAIWANGGKMPIFPTLTRLTGYFDPSAFAANTTIHVLGGPTTKLFFLTDWIDVGYSILSVGDLLIRLFAAIVLFYTIKSYQEKIYAN